MDSVLLAGGNKAVVKILNGKLGSRFKISDTNEASRVLRMQFSRDTQAGTLIITKEDYTRGLLAKFGVTYCRAQGTPGHGNELPSIQAESSLQGEGGGAVSSSCCRQRHGHGGVWYRLEKKGGSASTVIQTPTGVTTHTTREASLIVHQRDLQRSRREFQGVDMQG